MLPYQETYIENAKAIAGLSSFYSGSGSDFETWYRERQRAQTEIRRLRAENIDLLQRHLFPALDELHSATGEVIADLEAFADRLMDWSTNLDCGIYVVIHDALLRLYRFRRERDRIIKELYKLGMGLYYLHRAVEDIDGEVTGTFRFQNELVFTEAGSYIRYFEAIRDEETQGYIIRALANIALCTRDRRRKIAVTARTLRILQDENYRAAAPGLPWDVFLRRTHQQMSSNRNELSRGDLTREELAVVLDSCYEVFKPEEGAAEPSIRWLWPYYEMEYSCGYVDLKLTLERLEKLIHRTAHDQYDVSGFYGNVQLPIYYGLLMRDNPTLQREPGRVWFLGQAYRKMLRSLLTCPADLFDDYFFYLVGLVLSDYFEMPGVPSYREVTTRLMQRLSGELYVRSRRAGDMMRCLCAALWEDDPAFFDDIPFLRELPDGAEKREKLLAYAGDCGLYHDFGLIKMNLTRTMQTRNLFEDEFRMFQLHTVSGHDDLKKRPSTEVFADIALGHHSFYNGAGGYPDRYVRTDSPYRQMTDVAAVVSWLLEQYAGDPDAVIQEVLSRERTQFSPLVTTQLTDGPAREQIADLLRSDGEAYYRTIYRELSAALDRENG